MDRKVKVVDRVAKFVDRKVKVVDRVAKFVDRTPKRRIKHQKRTHYYS
ncbi:hypothetical protein [Lysinibacillus sp. NPDC093688]